MADNKCPGGCYFAECLEYARTSNADGFSFRGVKSKDPFCKMCKRDQVKKLQEEENSGVYMKRGKHKLYFDITQFYAFGR